MLACFVHGNSFIAVGGGPADVEVLDLTDYTWSLGQSLPVNINQVTQAPNGFITGGYTNSEPQK